MKTCTLAKAAQLAKSAYKKEVVTDPPVMRKLDRNDVQAYLLSGNVLLLPGSNSVRDYVKFNLRPLLLGGKQLTLKDPASEKGASGTKWHQGFLRYSKEIYDWLEDERVIPNFIIGHSLGAAAAQILSKSYDRPAIAFAAPRPKRSNNHVIRDGRCLIINRTDDPVAKAPDKYHHLGRARLMKSKTDPKFWAHAMPRYVHIVDEMIAAGKLPHSWSG